MTESEKELDNLLLDWLNLGIIEVGETDNGEKGFRLNKKHITCRKTKMSS